MTRACTFCTRIGHASSSIWRGCSPRAQGRRCRVERGAVWHEGARARADAREWDRSLSYWYVSQPNKVALLPLVAADLVEIDRLQKCRCRGHPVYDCLWHKADIDRDSSECPLSGSNQTFRDRLATVPF